ncbi:TPA: O48 family O-antigen polymerase [Escherichia coli]
MKLENNNADKKISFIGLLWLISCGLYITQITAISPVYFIFILSMILVFLTNVSCRKWDVSFFTLISLIISLLSTFLFINSHFSLVINLCMVLLSPMLVDFYYKGRSITKRNLLNVFLFYSFVFILDGFWRIQHPYLANVDKLEELGIGFQIYKVNSLMYADSNFVGLEAVFILSCFLYFFRDIKIVGLLRVRYFLVFCALFVGVVLTFSRAAIIAMILLFVLSVLMKNKRIKAFSYMLMPVLLIVLSWFVFKKFTDDISFESKFDLIRYSLEYIKNNNVEVILLGVGLGNAVDVIGMGAHNLFLTFLIETGMIGLFLFLVLLCIMCIYLKEDAIVIVLPFLIVSMSLGTTAIPYFFTFTWLCILFKRKLFNVI